MKKHSILSLFKFGELLVNARIAYNNVKNDEEAKKTATMFGKRSLLYFLAFALFSALAIGIILWSVKNFVSSLIFVAIIGFVAAVYLSIYAIGFYILSLNLAIKQKLLNNKAVGIIALVLDIVGIIALIVVAIVTLAMAL